MEDNKLRKYFFTLTLALAIIISFGGVSFASGSQFSKPDLYQAGYPYVKYYKDRAAGQSEALSGIAHSFYSSLGGNSTADEDVINNGGASYDQFILGRVCLEGGVTDILDTYVRFSKLANGAPNQFLCYKNIAAQGPSNPHPYVDASGNRVLNGPYRLVRVSGTSISNWWDNWDWALDTGAAACLIVYALDGRQHTTDVIKQNDYKNLAVMIGDYILKLQDTDGGFRMGPIGMYHASNTGEITYDFFWNLKSTEQNERCLYALQALKDVTQDVKYDQPISNIKGWIKSMYFSDTLSSTHLYRGSAQYTSGQWVPSILGGDNSYIVTDVIALAPIEIMVDDPYFGATQADRDAEIEAMFRTIEGSTAFTDNGKLLLFKFSASQAPDNNTTTYGTVEWSSQMALAYLKAAQIYALPAHFNQARREYYLNKYKELIASLENYFSPSIEDPSALIAPYASNVNGTVAGGVPTGTGYDTLNCKAALASAYFAFAKAGFDPMEIDGGPGIPVLAAHDQSVTLNQDSQAAITLSGYDPDSLTLTYIVLTQPSHGALSGTAPSLTYTPDAGYHGSDSFTFKVNNGSVDSNIATVSITINSIGPPNHPPVLAVIGNKSIDEGRLLQFTISATDPDGNALTYSAVGLPPGATFNSVSRVFSWAPNYEQGGILSQGYPVTFTVSDGSLTDAETITITVNNVNRAPVLAAIGNKPGYSGQALTFIVSATDPDNDSLIYSAFSMPAGAVLNPATGVFSWTPTAAQIGSFKITFKVSDGALSASETITITVTAFLGAPTNLITTGITRKLVTLYWQDNSTGEKGFYIERKLSTGRNFARIGKVKANITTYTDKRVVHGKVYYYRVRAFSGKNISLPSETITVSVPNQ